MPENPDRLASENVIINAPLSYAGSTQRIWRLRRNRAGALLVVVTVGVLLLTLLAWIAVTVWYVLFGLLLVPYRILRRGSRKRKRQALQHREMLAAIEHKTPAPGQADAGVEERLTD